MAIYFQGFVNLNKEFSFLLLLTDDLSEEMLQSLKNIILCINLMSTYTQVLPFKV